METTIFLVKIVGVYFIVSGVFLFTQRKTLISMLNDFFEHRAISFLTGVLLVSGGAALILRGNIGSDPLSIFLMVISWAILIKGILYILAPGVLHSLVKNISRFNFSLIGAFIALVGVYLVFFLG